MPMSPRLLRPRATGFDARSIANLVAWYDASDLSTLFSNDAATTAVTADSQVAVWRDKSRLGNHLSQTTANNRPLYRASSVNGRPAIDFDGSNDSLATRDSSNNLTFPLDLAAAKQISLVCVSIADSGNTLLPFSLKRNNFPDYVSGFAFYTTSSSNRLDIVFGQGDGTVNTSTYVTFAHSNTATSWHIASSSLNATGGSVVGRYNGATQSLTQPGGSAGTMAASSWLSQGTGNHNICMGARGFSANNTLGQFMDGRIAELMLFTRVLTGSEFVIIERYLARKYGVTLS